MIGVFFIAVLSMLAIGAVAFLIRMLVPGVMGANSIALDAVSLAVNVFFITPFVYIYMSKAYLSVLVQDAAEKGQIEIAPEPVRVPVEVEDEIEVIEVVEIRKD
jgi:hypothetical protein